MSRARDRSRTVLIADDEESVRDFVNAVLGSAGFRIISANDGEEALQVTLAEYPDLVILDVIMPKKEGLEVFEELRKDPCSSHIPVIMLTSINDYRLGEQWSEEKMTAVYGSAPEVFLEKPVTSEELLQTVRRIFGLSAADTV